MAQFDGIIINVWKNQKVHSDVNIMCQKPLIGQFESIIKTIWKNRKVHLDENLWLGKGNGSIMESMESGDTITWHNLFDPL